METNNKNIIIKVLLQPVDGKSNQKIVFTIQLSIENSSACDTYRAYILHTLTYIILRILPTIYYIHPHIHYTKDMPYYTTYSHVRSKICYSNN